MTTNGGDLYYGPPIFDVIFQDYLDIKPIKTTSEQSSDNKVISLNESDYFN